ncbi:hypothetical protein ACGFRG_01835 [Streptomyces sp. NPDC048696]|uniref:hypothetical protein n=1 Tax=Streptomyces sp. NPDC048696 TaxID=3365585 RepID=UPI00372181D5
MLVFFGLLLALVVFLCVVVVRRGRSRTENADGLLIEQQRRTYARSARTTFSSFAAHNAPPSTSDWDHH